MTKEEAREAIKEAYGNSEFTDEIIKALEQDPTTKNDSLKYCDRNICLKNEYNNIGCEDCEVTKSQKSTTKNDLGEDCVSRRAVDSLIWQYLRKETDDTIAFYEHFLDLPSVTPQEPRWIPTSERLPEDDGRYLLWGKLMEDEDDYYCFIGDYDSCCEEFGYWENYYDPDTLGFLDSEYIGYNRVIAWMPLPEPYKAESEE